MTVNPKYIRRFFTGPNKRMVWEFSADLNYGVIHDYEQFLFVKKSVADGEEFKKNSSIKGTKFLLEHKMDDDVMEFLKDNSYTIESVKQNGLVDYKGVFTDKSDLENYRVYTFFKKFGTGGGSVENDCLRFAESLAIGKYPYRGTRSFMKDNITENLLGESYERNFQIANEITDLLDAQISKSPYNDLDIEDNINNNANPEIGECYGMLSLWSPEGWAKMPYHFACVIFKDRNTAQMITTNITVEANVGDDTLQMPQFYLYDVGVKYRNYPFHDAWNKSFKMPVAPEFQIERNITVNSAGETIVTRTPPTPPPNYTMYYDNWGFLKKDDEYILNRYPSNNRAQPVTIVAVLKDKVINKNIVIVPKAFEKHSLTPKSPAPSPISSPEKMHVLLPRTPSPPRRARTQRRPPGSSATRARRRASATRRRQTARSANIRAARASPSPSP